MKLRQLQVFDTVARHLNITTAATELGMSQPTVSSQLKLLEQEFKKSFLKRSNRGVALTEQGQMFLEAVRPILIQMDQLKENYRSGLTACAKKGLVIGGSHTLSVTTLPAAIVEFYKCYPDTSVELRTNYSKVIETDVRNGTVDLGLITLTQNHPDCVYEAHEEYRAVAFAAPGNELCNKTLSLSQLCQHSIVTRKSSTIIEAMQKKGHQPHLVIQCDAPEAVKSAVKKGIGVGILFRGRVEEEIADGELCMIRVPEFEQIIARSFIVYSSREPLSMNARRFLETLRYVKNAAPSERDILNLPL